MNPTDKLVFKDQEAAERAVDECRWALVELIDKLREANKRIDSLELHRIVEAAEFDLKVRL